MEPTSWFSGNSSLTVADWAVLAAVVALMFFIGWWFSRNKKGTDNFFLAGRTIPWWAACLSFVATEISAMTIIGVPATAFRENWNYAQFFIGSALSRLVIAFLFIPAFYQFKSTTIYEFLRQRFGPASQYSATTFFFVTRLLASGVRLMAACVAVGVLFGWDIKPVIALFTVVGIVYIGYGGITAVVWTNVLQALTFLAAGAATIAYALYRIDGGIYEAFRIAGAAGKLQVWNWGPSTSDPEFWKKFFMDPNIVWVAILNGFFTSTAAFGTDHELMQKLLTVETRKASQKTVLLSMLGSFVTLMLFLMAGTFIFSFYQQNPSLVLPEKLDKIYPYFASNVMPQVLRGLVLSAIVMASIDSPLASLTAVFVTDIYKPLFKPKATEDHYMRVSHIAVVIFAVLLGLIAYYFSFKDKMLWLAFKVGGVTFGSMLGIFILGLATKRHADKANVVAMLAMAGINAYLLYLSETKQLALGWSWLVIIGTMGTFAIGWALGPLVDGKAKRA